MSVLWHEMKLQIDDFGADAELSHAIRGHHNLIEDYLEKRGILTAIHARGNLVAVHVDLQ